MDDAQPMNRGEHRGQLREVDELVVIEWRGSLEIGLQRVTRDELHRDRWQAILRLPRGVDGGHVRVLEAGRGPDLVLEARFDRVSIGAQHQSGMAYLDDRLSVRSQLLGEVRGRERAPAKEPQQLEVAELGVTHPAEALDLLRMCKRWVMHHTFRVFCGVFRILRPLRTVHSSTKVQWKGQESVCLVPLDHFKTDSLSSTRPRQRTHSRGPDPALAAAQKMRSGLLR